MGDAAVSDTHASAPQARPSNPLAEAILRGTAPRAMRLAAARGALPLGRPDLFRLVVALSSDADGEIASNARTSLEAWPQDEILHIGSDPTTDPGLLAFLAGWTGSDAGVLAVVLSNPSVPIPLLTQAVTAFSPERLDALLMNQTLVIGNPSLLDSVEANPNATPLQRTRVDEIRRHFLAPAAPAPAAEEEPPHLPEFEPPAPPEAADEDLSCEAGGSAAIAPPQPAPAAAAETSGTHHEESAAVSVMQRVMSLSVGDKIQLAYKGTREERTILIRDSNRSVQDAVLGSPKISESEVDAIARMRNVNEDVLRQISLNRDWMKAYTIMQGLSTNPKTPLGVSMGILPRLTTRDLKALQNDKNVPEALRRLAQKTVQARAAKPGSGPRGGR